MGLIRVHASVREQAKEVQFPSAGARILHSLQQNGMLKEFAVLNHQFDARRIHVDDSSGADVQVANFAISHLSFRQSHERPASLNKRVGIFTQQAVINWFTGQRDRVGFSFGSITPAVEDDEDEWLWMSHLSKSSCSSAVI